jgi:predicted NACHT family NTPase
MGPFDDQYIEGLRNWVASHSALGVMTTPLGLQMLASVFYRADDIPRSFTFLVQNIVVTVISRELARGTLYLADYELLGLLELIAFAMQSSSYIRTIIDQNAILTIVKQSDYYKKERPDSQLIRDLTSRSLLFQETGITQDGDSLFAFAHTAFREYFAASYLAKMSPQNFVETIAEHLSDASWEAVALSALELSQRQQGERFLDDIVRSAGQRGDPQLTNALRSWSQRVSGA